MGVATAATHRWIGALYTIRRASQAPRPLRQCLNGALSYVTVEVPEDFIVKMLTDLAEIFNNDALMETTVDRLLGRAGRLAYLVPSARPYVGMLWSAKSAADRHHSEHGRRGGRRYPTSRFQHAAAWIYTLLRPPAGQEWLPLEHVVTANPVQINLDQAPAVEFDASPWGVGAVLRQGGSPVAYFMGKWTEQDAKIVGAPLGDPAGQTSWEYVTLFIALYVFASDHRGTGLAVLGDNVSSLNLALNLKGNRFLGKVSREIGWRRIRLAWRYACGHLPSELNTTADALSRLHAPGTAAKAFPAELTPARMITPPAFDTLWTEGL